jgi:dihydropteroate synthase
MVGRRLGVVEVSSLAMAREEIAGIGCDPKSIEIMAPKAVLRVVRLQGVVLLDAVIIKQDMLSVGGEVAIPRDAYEDLSRTADILVFGTVAQLSRLVEKLGRHHPRLRGWATELASLVASFS